MDVYIEFVVIDNLVIDYIIIGFMEMTIGRKFAKWNKYVFLFFGCCVALVLPLIMSYKAISVLYRFATAIVLVLSLKKYRTIKEFLLYYLMFFAYTFFVGGVCLGVIQLLGIEYTMSSVVMYEFDFPFGVFALILLVIIKLMKRVVSKIKNQLKTSSYMRRIRLVDGECSVDGYGMLDTGNSIKYNGLGVSIISVDMVLKLYKDINIQDFFTGKIMDKFDQKGCTYIDIMGIGKNEKYLSFVLEYIEIDNKKFEYPRVAVAMKSLGVYDVILNNDFIGE